MSVEYWGIKGYGVCIDDISSYINEKKVKNFVKKFLSEENIEDDDFEDYMFCGRPYDNFAHFLCEFDDKNILTYEDDGQGVCYLLYAPPYPWQAKKNEPKTVNELGSYIVQILKKVCDADDKELSVHIDYINTWGGA